MITTGEAFKMMIDIDDGDEELEEQTILALIRALLWTRLI